MLAMLVMTASAVIIATWLRPNVGNVIAGTLTLYLTVTGALAPTRWVGLLRPCLVGLVFAGVLIASSAAALGLDASLRANGAIDGIPAPMFFMFGGVATIAALADTRLLLVGPPVGQARLVRHIWRMGFSLWIATLSFFIGQARHLPEVLREAGVLPIPVLLVTVVVAYWLVRAGVLRRGVRAPAAKSSRELGPRPASKRVFN